MTMNTPWDDIKTPSSNYNVRLVHNSAGLPLYWGKNPCGECMFIVELEGDHIEQYRKTRLTIKGVGIDLQQSTTQLDRQQFILSLEKHVDRDLFLVLCESLIKSLYDEQNSAVGLSIALNHLKRWKLFLSGKKKRVLSSEEIRGLFGELTFLKLLYQKHLHKDEALEAWCGPDRTNQDFIYDDLAVEIKTLSGKERKRVNISSEDQLESTKKFLYLSIYHLNTSSGSDLGKTLNELVTEIESDIEDLETSENFTKKLLDYGYIPIDHYDKPKFTVTGTQTYHVRDEFPRMTRSGLETGICQVSYKIEIEYIEPFKVEEEYLFRR